MFSQNLLLTIFENRTAKTSDLPKVFNKKQQAPMEESNVLNAVINGKNKTCCIGVP